MSWFLEEGLGDERRETVQVPVGLSWAGAPKPVDESVSVTTATSVEAFGVRLAPSITWMGRGTVEGSLSQGLCLRVCPVVFRWFYSFHR